MNYRIGYLYIALAAALAVAFGASVGPYWVDDAVVFAVFSFAICVSCFARVDEAPRTDSEDRGYFPRSRIAHYALVSRIKSGSSTALASYNPFERAVLSEPDWRTLSAEELKRIIMEHRREPSKDLH
jgi:hypothetical protein